MLATSARRLLMRDDLMERARLLGTHKFRVRVQERKPKTPNRQAIEGCGCKGGVHTWPGTRASLPPP